MKSVMKAIGAALRTLFRAVVTVGKYGLGMAMLPLEYISSFFSAGAGDELPEPEPEQTPQRGYSAEQVADDPEIQKAINLNPLARIFGLFLVRPDDRKNYSLKGLDTGLQAWARTLPDEEVSLLKKSGLVRTIAHMTGEYPVRGVRLPLGVEPMQSLTPEPTAPKAGSYRYESEPSYQPQPIFA